MSDQPQKPQDAGSGSDQAGASSSNGRPIPDIAERHLWQFAWIRDLMVLLLLALILMLMLAASTVVTPVLVGLALAYVFNPLVTFLYRKRVPRWLASLSILLIALLFGAALLLYVTPKAIGQVAELVRNVPGQVQRLSDRYDWRLEERLDGVRDSLESTLRGTLGLVGQADAVAQPPPEAMADDPEDRDPEARPADEHGEEPDPDARVRSQTGTPQWEVDYQQLAEGGWLATRWVMSRLLEILGFFTWLFISLLLVAASFIYFSWHLPELGNQLDPLLPPRQRDLIWRMIGRMDRAVSAWLRGRLLQSLVVAVLLSLGWWLVGVPYWLVLGILGGVLNLIPYAAGIAWPLAVGLTWVSAVGTEEPPSLLWIILAPTIVYLIAQFVDGSVMEPLVQGKATELNWLVVLVAVMIGGAVFGFIGLILAIPVTACIKILWQEWLRPRLLEYVQGIG
ncbi:MAG: AI-2E family transporter [Phycisphaeraceae bacterium]|nr:AI-2E family transporter [Phycisphaeraceae bacterium]